MIEREFDRYYELLKSQLRDGSEFTDVRDQEDLKITASLTFDKSKAWNNPNLHIPIEKAHLKQLHQDDPQFYEQLCVQYEDSQQQKDKQDDNRDIDIQTLESLLKQVDLI